MPRIFIVVSLLVTLLSGVVQPQQGQEENVQPVSIEETLKALTAKIQQLEQQHKAEIQQARADFQQSLQQLQEKHNGDLAAVQAGHKRDFDLLGASLQDHKKIWEKHAPVGTVISYFGNKIPDGWIVCNGATIHRDQYPNLVAHLSSLGMGNGTTATLPDLRGVFLRGQDLGRNLDPQRSLGTLQQDENLAHTHTAATSTNGDHAHGGNTNVTGDHAHSGNTNVVGDHAHNGSTNVVGDHAHSGETNTTGNHAHDCDDYCWSEAWGPLGNQGWVGSPGNDNDNGPMNPWRHASLAAGNHAHSLGTNTAGNHQHPFGTNTAGNHAHTIGTNTTGNHGHTISTNSTGNHNHAVTIGSTGSESRPKNVAIVFVIKY